MPAAEVQGGGKARQGPADVRRIEQQRDPGPPPRLSGVPNGHGDIGCVAPRQVQGLSQQRPASPGARGLAAPHPTALASG